MSELIRATKLEPLELSRQLESAEQLEQLPYPVYFVNIFTEKWRDLMESKDLPANVEHLLDKCADGFDIWSAQTYIYLKQRGLNVHLVSRCIPGKICFVPYHHLMIRNMPFNSYVVGCRLDSARPEICEQQTVLNDLCVIQSTDHFIPQWPQCNLKRRDPSRGTNIETLSFKGNRLNLALPFRDSVFLGELQSLGMQLAVSPDDPRLQFEDWKDYTQTDVVLAVRNVTAYDLTLKPASKLINAWFAGCPAILGPEPAYQTLRQSELDFIEVSNVEEVIVALRKLKDNPALYSAMIENGFKRAQEFSTDRLALLWRQLLAGPIAQGYEQWLQQPLAHKLIGRPFKFIQRAIQHKREEKYYLYNRENGERPFGSFF